MQPHDRLFCEIAVQLGLLSRAQVNDCIVTLQREPRGRTIGEVAAALGLLTQAEVDHVQGQQQRVLLRRRQARAARRADSPPKPPPPAAAPAAGPDPAASGITVAYGGAARSQKKDPTPTAPWRHGSPPHALSSRKAALLESAQARPAASPPDPRQTSDERPQARASKRVAPKDPASGRRQPAPARQPPGSEHASPLARGLAPTSLQHESQPTGSASAASGASTRAAPSPPAGAAAPEGLRPTGPGSSARTPPLPEAPAAAPSMPSRSSGDAQAQSVRAPLGPRGTQLGAAALHAGGSPNGAGSAAASAPTAGPAGRSVGSGPARGTLLGPSALVQGRPPGGRQPASARVWRNPSRPPSAADGLDLGAQVAIADAPVSNDASARAHPSPAAGQPRLLQEALQLAAESGASDLHLHGNAPMLVRIDGKLSPLGSDTPIPAAAVEQAIAEVLDEAQQTQLVVDGELSCACEIVGVGRVRIHAFSQQQGTDAVVRLFPSALPAPDKLGLAGALRALRECSSGLCLVTGPSGCGKTTSVAALVAALAKERALHAITLDRPIEIAQSPGLGLFEQREVGRDVATFAEGVALAQRQGADVIAVSDVSEAGALRACLRAARAGCWVIAALRASSSAQAIARLIGGQAAAQLERARFELAQGLRVVLHQRLLPRARVRGRVAAVEVLVNTSALAQLIREDKLQQLPALTAAGKQAGMLGLDAAIEGLVRSGVVAAGSAPGAHRRFKLA